MTLKQKNKLVAYLKICKDFTYFGGVFVTVRKIQADFQQMFDLAAYAFVQNKSAEQKERFTYLAKNSENYGSFADEILASQIMATPFFINFWDQTFKMKGIGFVSTYPEFRKQGRIDAIMREILQDSYKQGTELSYLAPFSYPFYRRYGYESAFLQIRYEASPEMWPFAEKSMGKVRRITFPAAKEVMKTIYQKSDESQKGGLQRAEWWLKYKFDLHKDFNFAIYEEKSEARGYVVYQIVQDKLEIMELIALTQSGFNALHAFIKAHSGTVKKIGWSCPYNGETKLLQVCNPQVDVKILPYMMARVVNILAFLKAYPWQNKIKQSFTIEIVADSFLPVNNGCYEITPEKSVKQVATSKLPRIKVTPQSFTQLFLGSVSLNELRAAEKIELSTDLARQLTTLLPTEKPLLGDYF